MTKFKLLSELSGKDYTTKNLQCPSTVVSSRVKNKKKFKINDFFKAIFFTLEKLFTFIWNTSTSFQVGLQTIELFLAWIKFRNFKSYFLRTPFSQFPGAQRTRSRFTIKSRLNQRFLFFVDLIFGLYASWMMSYSIYKWDKLLVLYWNTSRS